MLEAQTLERIETRLEDDLDAQSRTRAQRAAHAY